MHVGRDGGSARRFRVATVRGVFQVAQCQTSIGYSNDDEFFINDFALVVRRVVGDHRSGRRFYCDAPIGEGARPVRRNTLEIAGSR